MKKIFYLAFLLLVVSACCKISLSAPSASPTNILTKADCIFDKEYFVSEEDINAYIKFKALSEKQDPMVDNIEPFTIDGDTVFYVVNYSKGWEIISADKRTPYLLGRGLEGSFSMDKFQDTPWATWMATIGEDVKQTQMFGNKASFEDNEYLQFWTLIKGPYDVKTKGQGLPPILNPAGHFELVDVDVSLCGCDSITHLIKTHWHQLPPYNAYCPFNNDSSAHVKAGCVAVAGAQVLNYLHDIIGTPETMPDSGYCTGKHNGIYTQDFFGNSTALWDEYCEDYAAIAIGYVGKTVGMNYKENHSGVRTKKLVDRVFIPWGIDCTFDSYDPSFIIPQLHDNHLPIILSARSLVLFDTWEKGHSFILDGYYRDRKKYTYYYEWVYDEELGTGGIATEPPRPYTEVAYSYTNVSQIWMNWGWSITDFNNASFSPGGDWEIVINNPDDTTRYNFQYRRRMIYGFSNSQIL